MTNEEAIRLAKEARKNHYTPYSHFAVGAVVITKDGKHFFGANMLAIHYVCVLKEMPFIMLIIMAIIKKILLFLL